MEEKPDGSRVNVISAPKDIMGLSPVWKFEFSDEEKWSVRKNLTPKVFAVLKRLETQKWHEILITAKKHNHSIDAKDLNKIAQVRIGELNIDIDKIYSLKVNGKTRVYGYFLGESFAVLWVDTDHGDNDTCVCRSQLRNT